MEIKLLEKDDTFTITDFIKLCSRCLSRLVSLFYNHFLIQTLDLYTISLEIPAHYSESPFPNANRKGKWVKMVSHSNEMEIYSMGKKMSEPFLNTPN
jgi:hypothetical protein